MCIEVYGVCIYGKMYGKFVFFEFGILKFESFFLFWFWCYLVFKDIKVIFFFGFGLNLLFVLDVGYFYLWICEYFFDFFVFVMI